MELNERLAHYQRALEYLLEDQAALNGGISCGVCGLLCGIPNVDNYLANTVNGQEAFIKQNFPEFAALKPEIGADYFPFWWHETDFYSRINALQICIKQVRDEISKTSIQ